MKTFVFAVLIAFLVGGVWAAPAVESPLTAFEQTLTFSSAYLRTDGQGHGYLLVQGEPLSAARLRGLSPWDLMDLVQKLSRAQIPLSRFGDNDELTQAWRQRLVAFAATADTPSPPPPENLFDPALVLWDPGYIQQKNQWGQWSIHLQNRDIVQADVAALSPLEVQQAVEVLTARTYPIDFVLDHLEQFRSQLRIGPPEDSALAAPR